MATTLRQDRGTATQTGPGVGEKRAVPARRHSPPGLPLAPSGAETSAVMRVVLHLVRNPDSPTDDALYHMYRSGEPHSVKPLSMTMFDTLHAIGAVKVYGYNHTENSQ